ncbi:hypothetical protein VOLCADRAFT_90835 [Volvox carteri f. nagariensis]|uniref:Uncharacterized protein n=1 Tax=Volvox carteri f. nagariensis TaxID=3068 RepID=D8TV67_VOLCA|nr:uncharacterized protein VOLCADRAFT_90835 [Volvox carteri f. nagariensis]EFJ48650.1 hypothetical protein VOLCADRAFT_90835 [Volvox carteri f. nagariensis]|eukprot:XP_002950449.1 hypothetical protein VOLCADRAFT_90835 [Volvox carteri f. nagariensis]
MGSLRRAGGRFALHRAASPAVVRASLGDFFSGFFDGSWAPKSTRIWRKQSFEFTSSDEKACASGCQSHVEESSSSGNVDRALDDLQARVNSVPAGARPSLENLDSSDNAADNSGFDGTSPLSRSFSEVDDGDLAAALNRRIGQIAASTASYDSEVTEEEMRTLLSAQELRQLIFTKYGKTYDVSFVRRDIPGKTFVCLNIMWNHLEQRSFKLTEQQYMEKLDGVAYLVGALGQTDKVRAFLKEPARSQKGLPPRPVVGTAISIRFDLEPGVIEEWFGNGYQ